MYAFISLGRIVINKRLFIKTRFLYKTNIFYCTGTKIVEEKDKNDFTTIPSKNLSYLQTLVAKSPTSIQPYLKLLRIDKPIGSWLIIWPSTWGVAIAASPGCLPDPYLLTIFTLGSFIMRGVGCTVNDMLDREIDSKVQRTKDRPLVQGTLDMKNALIFLAGQLSFAFVILVQLNWYSIILGASCLGLVVLYPLMKRITYWPQVVLGVTLNWGVLLGYSASHGAVHQICLPMFLSAICWTVVYDTIYAQQDMKDDIKHGVFSTAIRFGDNLKIWLSSFAVLNISGLTFTGYLFDQTWPYYTAVLVSGSHLFWQIHDVNTKNTNDCSQKHRSNNVIGLAMFLGITIGNYFKLPKENTTTEKPITVFE